MHLRAVCFESLNVFSVCSLVGLCVVEIWLHLDGCGSILEHLGSIWKHLLAFGSG